MLSDSVHDKEQLLIKEKEIGELYYELGLKYIRNLVSLVNKNKIASPILLEDLKDLFDVSEDE